MTTWRLSDLEIIIATSNKIMGQFERERTTGREGGQARYFTTQRCSSRALAFTSFSYNTMTS